MISPSDGPAPANVVAFVSAAAGTGCTSTVANLACALAIEGRRVLVVDWRSDDPRVREYLEPFQTGRVALPPALAEAWAVERRERPSTASLTRFEVPGTAGQVDLIEMLNDDDTERYPSVLGESTAAAVLRKLLPKSGYDLVFVDAPAHTTNRPLQLIATVCDTAVVCFRPRQQTIRNAAELATRLRRLAPIQIDVVPVATAFDDSHPRRDRLRAAIRDAFAPLVDNNPVIEIPHRSFETFEPLLAILTDEPAATGAPPNPLHTGYEQLAAAVTGGAVDALTPVSAGFRAQYRRAFGLTSPTEPDTILVAHTACDRPWADWVRAWLEHAGTRTRSLSGDPPDAASLTGLVVISSADFDESPQLASVTELMAAADRAGTPLTVFRVVVDGTGAAPARTASSVVAAGLERATVAEMLNHFALIDQPGTDATATGRRPGDRPAIFSVPPRLPRFVGRDEDIEALRDQLTERAGAGTTLTIGGIPGVGKSELALEYAHRFAGDYDLVWWIPAADDQSILISLAELAARLNLSGSHNYGSTAALGHLTEEQGHRRFLLIYDNLTDQSGLPDLLPSGHQGHVLITSSETRSADLELGPMTEADAVRLLGDRVPGITHEDAARVATAARNLPIVVELAAAWLTETATARRAAAEPVADAATLAVHAFLGRLDADGDPASGSPEAMARLVAVVAGRLREDPVGQVALGLAELCSFLSQDGIGLDLVRSTAMLRQLAIVCGPEAERLLLDAWEIDRALWAGVRYGLFRVDWGEQSMLRVHRTVQTALRDGLPPADREALRAAVLSALAGYAPTEVEEYQARLTDRFVELQKHVFPSGAVDSDDPFVRRWLVNQVRFLYAKGGSGVHRAAVGPARKLLDSWTERYGTADQLRLRLAVQLANLYRALGDHQQALALDDAALVEHRRTLPLDHPQSLINRRGRGGDLRGMGLFADAVDEDRAVWEGLRAAFGEDHRHTQMAAGNLASSLYLSGDVHGALTVADGSYRRRRRLFGPEDLSTWMALTRVGVYLRELGRYAEAYTVLTEARQHLRRPGLPQRELSVRWHLAITMRCEGKAIPAKDRTCQAMLDYRKVFGRDHPNTLACTVSYAAALRAVGGDADRAVELVEDALTRFRANARLPADHPFVALYQLALGLAKCAAGRDGTEHTGAALTLLTDRLGDVHPWSLAAAIDHARTLAAAGDPEAAELITTAHENCLEFLGVDHPHTRIAEHNRALVSAVDPAGQGWREIDVDIPET